MNKSAAHLDWLNSLPKSEAEHELLKCCGSRSWATLMVESRSFESINALTERAADVWWSLESADWLEAFRSHPKIGEQKSEVQVSTQAQSWSGQEQSGVARATEQTLAEMAKLNRDYEAKFGYIFIVCATGKSPEEMLLLLKSRMSNQPVDELRIAAGEQAKITEIRLRKLIA
jgi:OHCU decarboxylase